MNAAVTAEQAKKIRDAVRELEFEQAAMIRDRIRGLRELMVRLP